MQIDLHHAMTWVVARDSGFSIEDANIIAYASQYVDDATNYGTIRFTNGAAYERIATAHKMLEYRNLQQLVNMKVWVPFHFLPGNGGLPAGENPEGTFIQKLICKPGSYIAQDMVNECIADKHRPYSLHRLGITSHVFIDTWGHKGFAGINHDINIVNDIKDKNGHSDEGWFNRVSDYFANCFQDEIPSLGHGQALSNPDLPHQKWSYINGLDEEVNRDNPTDFLEAANELCKVYQKYQGKSETGLTQTVNDAIAQCFVEFELDDGEKRHEKWLTAIKDDRFGLGAYELDYVAKGKGSWKAEALGKSRVDREDKLYEFTPEFLTSNWKYFHDAAKRHRLTVIEDILPLYGICVS